MKYWIDGWMDGLVRMKQIAFESDYKEREEIQQAKAIGERYF